MLKQRLARRGYPAGKLVDNLEAELIGLVASDAYRAFGDKKTWELDTTYTTSVEAAEAVTAAVKRGSGRGPRLDWTLNYDSGGKLRSLFSPA